MFPVRNHPSAQRARSEEKRRRQKRCNEIDSELQSLQKYIQTAIASSSGESATAVGFPNRQAMNHNGSPQATAAVVEALTREQFLLVERLKLLDEDQQDGE